MSIVAPSMLHRVLRVVVVLGVLALMSLFVLHSESDDDWVDVVSRVFVAIGLGAVYGLGFLWYLPEAIAGPPPVSRGGRPERIRRFLRTGLWILLACLLAAALSGTDEFGFGALAVVGGLYLALTIQLRALEQVIAPSSPSEVGSSRRGRDWMRRVLRRMPSRWALAWGSALVLFSIAAVTSEDLGCGGRYRGYQIVSGDADWITGESDSSVTEFTRFVGRGVYVLGLYVALIALGILLVRALARTDLGIWRGLSGVVALWVISDLGLYFVPFSVATLLWLVSALLWARYGTSKEPACIQRWEGIRAAYLILVLPVVLIADALLAFAYRVHGFVAFYFGVQLLWWGFATMPAMVSTAPHVSEVDTELPIEVAPST